MQLRMNTVSLTTKPKFIYFFWWSRSISPSHKLRKFPRFALRINYCANIATLKVAVMFTDRLKIGNKGSFCSPNALNSNFDNSIVCLETRLSPFAQNDHLKPKLSLCCHFAMKPER